MSNSALKKFSKTFIFERETVSEQSQEIEILRQRISQLEQQLYELQPKEIWQEGQHDEYRRLSRNFNTHIDPLKLPYTFTPIQDLYLITITLPPKRFPSTGYHTNITEYLKYNCFLAVNYSTHIYGCLEYHKNGRPHAHLIVSFINQPNKEAYLKKINKNVAENEYTIKVDEINDLEGAITYINKSSKDNKKERGFFFFLYEIPQKIKTKEKKKIVNPKEKITFEVVNKKIECHWCCGTGIFPTLSHK